MPRRRPAPLSLLPALGAAAMLVACTPAPPPVAPLPASAAPPPVVAKAEAPLPEVKWAAEKSDEAGVTLGANVPGGADSVAAVVVSVSCGTAKIGKGEAAGDHATLRLEAADVATAIQCRGLQVTVGRGKQATTSTVPFDLVMRLPDGVAGGIGVSRTTKSPDAILAVPGNSASSQLTVDRETYPARGASGGNVEFAVPLLALTRAALRKQHVVAKTGLKPIEYLPGLTIAGQAVAQDAAP